MIVKNELAPDFVEKLLEWNGSKNLRQMPWKGEKDPYKIWLSEIILQQTRVGQGMKYYENFIRQYPLIQSLAAAPEEEVFKLWEGLGYYSRCRNLIETARYISNDLNGKFPTGYQSILELKGIGPYTAAAISSFAYNLPYAVLDGNVFRVLSRIFKLEEPVDSTKGKKIFSIIAQNMLPHEKAGAYNQAIMDFGAVICKPLPDCPACFFNQNCPAFQSGMQSLLPIKEKKAKIKERWMHYFLMRCNGKVLVRKRSGKDIWQQLHEFVLVETVHKTKDVELYHILRNQFDFTIKEIEKISQARQKLTHQLINFSFYEVSLAANIEVPGYHWVKEEKLRNYAFPRYLQQFASGFF